MPQQISDQSEQDATCTMPQPTGQETLDLERNELESRLASVVLAEKNCAENLFLVSFESGDPENPMNFTSYFKAWLTLALGLLALTGSIGASIITPAEQVISKVMEVNQETSVLALALFVLGMPTLWFSPHCRQAANEM